MKKFTRALVSLLMAVSAASAFADDCSNISFRTSAVPSNVNKMFTVGKEAATAPSTPTHMYGQIKITNNGNTNSLRKYAAWEQAPISCRYLPNRKRLEVTFQATEYDWQNTPLSDRKVTAIFTGLTFAKTREAIYGSSAEIFTETRDVYNIKNVEAQIYNAAGTRVAKTLKFSCPTTSIDGYNAPCFSPDSGTNVEITKGITSYVPNLTNVLPQS